MLNEIEQNEKVVSEEKSIDYDFLHENEKNQDQDVSVTDKFDEAFSNSSKVIQDYILSDKFEENIRLICKIQKLDDNKSNTIIENVAVSILVGLLPITEAKNTLIESFKSSGILLEDTTAGLALKNIDTYILSDIRKQILQSKVENNKEIRHLTLKQSTEEKEKEELRKILLEKTGNLNGKGEVLVQYQTRDNGINKNTENTDQKQELNRDSLLARINLKNVSNSDKIKERMTQIKKEEDERLAKLAEEEKKKEELHKQREEEQTKTQESAKQERLEEDKEQDVSKLFAESLKIKLENKEKNDNVDILREVRKGDEEKTSNQNRNLYSKEIIMPEQNTDSTEAFDPYRENL